MNWYGTKEAAEKLGVTQQYVARLCREGAFPQAKQAWDSHPWRIPESDLEAFLQQRTRKEPTDEQNS